MYVQFGQEWSKLNHGFMWSGVDGEKMDTMEVHVLCLCCDHIFKQ